MMFFLWWFCFFFFLRGSESDVGVEDEEEEEYFLPCPLSVVFVLIRFTVATPPFLQKVFREISVVQTFAIGNHQAFDMESCYIIKRHSLSKLSGFGTNQLSF